jgi:tetratricopeptide (TPR) repeat protein
VEYDKIMAEKDRGAPRAVLPQAEMVYYEQGESERGLKLLEAALRDERVGGIERYRALFRVADRFQKNRDYANALKWLAIAPELPSKRAGEVKRYSTEAYYRMGRVHLARNDVVQAKSAFRKAMNLEGGNAAYRVRARDGIEDIEYFE